MFSRDEPLRVVRLSCIRQADQRRKDASVAEDEDEVGVETSFEELAKRAESKEEEEEEDTAVDLGRDDDNPEALIEKVVPIQANEFTCRNCFLVKHQSQLADKKRVFCRDCA